MSVIALTGMAEVLWVLPSSCSRTDTSKALGTIPISAMIQRARWVIIAWSSPIGQEDLQRLQAVQRQNSSAISSIAASVSLDES